MITTVSNAYPVIASPAYTRRAAVPMAQSGNQQLQFGQKRKGPLVALLLLLTGWGAANYAGRENGVTDPRLERFEQVLPRYSTEAEVCTRDTAEARRLAALPAYADIAGRIHTRSDHYDAVCRRLKRGGKIG